MNVAVNEVNDIVRWLLHYEQMTHKKMQKLLYFCYGIYLFRNNFDENNINTVLFSNNFEAWVHGPVIPEIYAIYKVYGVNDLSIEENVDNFDERVMEALNETMQLYGNYSADELEYITHNQLPWKNARQGLSSMAISNNVISITDIYLTFKEILTNE